MVSKVYTGIAYRQSRNPDAPWIVSFVAPAEELLQWVGIPRRTEESLVGFQRLDDLGRITQAKEFFEKSINQSPTSLIVGIHRPPDEASRSVFLQFSGGTEKDSIRSCELTVDFDDIDQLDVITQRIRAQIQPRLAEGDDDSDEDDTAEEDEEAAADFNEDTEDEIEAAEIDDAVELGRSQLRELLAKLSDNEWAERNIRDLRDMSKPATLIDGQHRVKGAELCERGIPFSICAIYDCAWSEQVFQFTVVNYTQKGIPDQFITANAALSLTKGELNELEDRLVQAKVKVVEYELMRIVNFDERSPFAELINLTEKSSSEKIGYKTMVRVAKAWYSANDEAVKQIVQSIYPDFKGKKSDVRRLRMEAWKRSDWGEFFLAFWNVVHEHYGRKPSHLSGHTLWDVGNSNLTVAIVLLELQARFMANLRAQDEEFFEPKTDHPLEEIRDKVKDRARKFVEWIPAEFFARQWGITSLNTSAGRSALQDVLYKLDDSKGKYQFGKHAIITGKVGGS